MERELRTCLASKDINSVSTRKKVLPHSFDREVDSRLLGLDLIYAGKFQNNGFLCFGCVDIERETDSTARVFVEKSSGN